MHFSTYRVPSQEPAEQHLLIEKKPAGRYIQIHGKTG